VPGVAQRRRQLDLLGDLVGDVTLVDQPQSLVVKVGVQVGCNARNSTARARSQVGQ
jgi:hypothetical protein